MGDVAHDSSEQLWSVVSPSLKNARGCIEIARATILDILPLVCLLGDPFLLEGGAGGCNKGG